MYNLLTEKNKKVVKREYYLRLFYSITFFVLITLFILFFSWAPFYYFLTLRSDFVNNHLLGLQEQNNAQENKKIDDAVSNLNAQITLLKPSMDSLPIRNIFLHISDEAPQGIAITGLSWTTGKGNGGTFYVKGIAKDRDVMQTFVKVLQIDNTFSAVDFSRSQYAKESNADFSLTLTYKP